MFLPLFLVLFHYATGASVSEREPKTWVVIDSKKAMAQPRALFEFPILSTLMVFLGFLAFMFPFRLFRVAPFNTQAANTRKGSPLPDSATTMRPMEEVADVARRFISALEKDGTCVNYTACNFASDVSKLGGKQQITLGLLEKLTPTPLLPSLNILKDALTGAREDRKKYCEQFTCLDVTGSDGKPEVDDDQVAAEEETSDVQEVSAFSTTETQLT